MGMAKKKKKKLKDFGEPPLRAKTLQNYLFIFFLAMGRPNHLQTGQGGG
jgi:hypothetical protein